MHTCTFMHTYTYSPATRVVHTIYDRSFMSINIVCWFSKWCAQTVNKSTSMHLFLISYSNLFYVRGLIIVLFYLQLSCTLYLNWNKLESNCFSSNLKFWALAGIHRVTRAVRLNNNTSFPPISREFPGNPFTGCLITMINRA